MKKMFFVLTALLLTVPALANVTISCAQYGLYGQGKKAVVISYVATEDTNLPRGFGLNVSVSGGVTITSVAYTNPKYWVYPGSIVIDTNDPPEVVSQGTPVASGLGTSNVILEMGSLHYPTGPTGPNSPALSAVLIRLNLSGTGCTVTVSGNGTRGNVVNYAAEEAVVVYGPPCVMADECLKNTAPEYAVWTNATYDNPVCWCFKRQCRGDGDGLAQGPLWVSTNDLALLRLAIGKPVLPVGGICSDYDHAAQGPLRVSTNDLTILRSWIGKPVVTCCDTVVPAGNCVLEPADKWRFWTN
jgi:hypothetical protein